jgi:hypothetical protein
MDAKESFSEFTHEEIQNGWDDAMNAFPSKDAPKLGDASMQGWDNEDLPEDPDAMQRRWDSEEDPYDYAPWVETGPIPSAKEIEQSLNEDLWLPTA